jgi:putative hydrolase of the HAD superfamily
VLKGAIFDMGDTLIHLTASMEQIRDSRIHAIYDALLENGATVGFDELKRSYAALHEEESDHAARTLEEIDVAKSLPKLLDRLRVDPKLRPPTFDLVKKFFALEVDSWVLFSGVHEMLAGVRVLGLKMGILSNSRSDWAIKEITNRLDIAKYFDATVTSAAVGLRKPRPEPFREVLRELGLKADETVMIGNSVEADIAGARPLGFKTIHVIFGNDTEEKDCDPDETVYSVSEILPAIKRLATR